jgi:hypothetical protein
MYHGSFAITCHGISKALLDALPRCGFSFACASTKAAPSSPGARAVAMVGAGGQEETAEKSAACAVRLAWSSWAARDLLAARLRVQ